MNIMNVVPTKLNGKGASTSSSMASTKTSPKAALQAITDDIDRLTNLYRDLFRTQLRDQLAALGRPLVLISLATLLAAAALIQVCQGLSRIWIAGDTTGGASTSVAGLFCLVFAAIAVLLAFIPNKRPVGAVASSTKTFNVELQKGPVHEV